MQAMLTHIATPIVACVLYLVLSLGGLQFLLRKCTMRKVMVLHNFALSIGSLVMFVGATLAILERGRSSARWDWLLCESGESAAAVRAAYPTLYRWSYVYYLSKFYELIDTMLQICKGNRVRHPWLHIYHHAVVMFMAWSWYTQAQSLQFIGMLFNTAVHVIMYAYYGLASAGVKDIWWKRYITKFQILQFACSFGFLLQTMKLILVDGRECLGFSTLVLNSIFNATLLVQFIDLLRPKKGKSQQQRGRTHL